MSIKEYFLYGGGGAAVGGLVGLFLAGPPGAVVGASTGGSLAMSICSSEATDRLKQGFIANITDLVNDLSHQCTDRLLNTTHSAIHSLTSTANNAMDQLVRQARLTTITASNSCTFGFIGLGFYFVIANDLSSRCSTLPIGCYTLTAVGSLMLVSLTLAANRIFHSISVAVQASSAQIPDNSAQSRPPILGLQKGLNLMGKCKNIHCSSTNKDVVLSKGLGKFDIGKLIGDFICPGCKTPVKNDGIDIAAKDCMFSYKGICGSGAKQSQKPTQVKTQKLNLDGWAFLKITTT